MLARFALNQRNYYVFPFSFDLFTGLKVILKSLFISYFSFSFISKFYLFLKLSDKYLVICKLSRTLQIDLSRGSLGRVHGKVVWFSGWDFLTWILVVDLKMNLKRTKYLQNNQGLWGSILILFDSIFKLDFYRTCLVLTPKNRFPRKWKMKIFLFLLFN